MPGFFAEDDSDMKIADFSDGRPKEATLSPREPDKDPAYLELMENRKNGNLDKARRLGAALADEAAYAEKSGFLKPSPVREDYAVLSQCRVLMCFAATVGAETCTPNLLTAHTALNVFYDRLKRQSPQLYEEVNEAGSFSFYLLEYRKGGDVERGIGRAFAMLCGRDGDAVCSELGETLYCRCLHIGRKRAKELAFVN